MENLARCSFIVFCFSILICPKVLSQADFVAVDGEKIGYLDFKASYNGNFTLLEWRTEKEIQNGHYIIEVSFDEENYDQIAEVKNMKNFKTFSYIDNNNLLKNSFYRLRFINEEGEFSYSSVAMVKVNPLNQLKLFPIPTKNILNIKGFIDHSDDLDIKITDLHGNNYRVFNLIKVAEDHYTIDFSSLSPNTYFVKVSNNGKSATYRVMKL